MSTPPENSTLPHELSARTYERLSLYNELKALNLPHTELMLTPFALTEHYGTLELSCELGSFTLTFPTLMTLWQLSELSALSAREPHAAHLGLPDELLLAALEVNLQPYFTQLSTTLGTELTVRAYRTMDAPAAEPEPEPYLSQSFYGTIGAVKLPLTLSCPERSAADHLLEAVRSYHDRVHQALKALTDLTPLAAQHRHELGAELRVPLYLSIGLTEVSLALLQTLEPGAALMIDECYLPQDELLVSYQHGDLMLCARAQLHEGQLTLQTNFVPRMEESTMAEPAQTETTEANASADATTAATTPAPVAESAPVALEALKFKVSLVLDEQVLTLAELQELKQGSVLPLVHHDLSHVALVVNGQTVGYGRVVTVGTDFALQLTELAPAKEGACNG